MRFRSMASTCAYGEGRPLVHLATRSLILSVNAGDWLTTTFEATGSCFRRSGGTVGVSRASTVQRSPDLSASGEAAERVTLLYRRSSARSFAFGPEKEMPVADPTV